MGRNFDGVYGWPLIYVLFQPTTLPLSERWIVEERHKVPEVAVGLTGSHIVTASDPRTSSEKPKPFLHSSVFHMFTFKLHDHPSTLLMRDMLQTAIHCRSRLAAGKEASSWQGSGLDIGQYTKSSDMICGCAFLICISRSHRPQAVFQTRNLAPLHIFLYRPMSQVTMPRLRNNQNVPSTIQLPQFSCNRPSIAIGTHRTGQCSCIQPSRIMNWGTHLSHLINSPYFQFSDDVLYRIFLSVKHGDIKSFRILIRGKFSKGLLQSTDSRNERLSSNSITWVS